MNIILLSGGSGKLLWPLSNDVRSKQFIKLLKSEDGSYESILQRAYRQIRAVDKNASVTVVTSRMQVPSVNNQLDDLVKISEEPFRRGTLPAISLAAMYLNDVENVDPEEPVVVCPVDAFADIDYYSKLLDMTNQVKTNESKLVLMGIEPDVISDKYGYIIPKSTDEISFVDTFKEKPSKDVAKEYIENGALWNCGVFACKLSYLVEKAHAHIEFADYYDLYKRYESVKETSFDYAVVEHEKSIQVMRFAGKWKDIGNWNTLSEMMDETIVGKGIAGGDCENVSIINEMDVPILAMGLKDVVITASPQGILVTDKTESVNINSYVDAIDERVMFAEKSWGSYKVMDVDDRSMTIKITLNAGHSMNYHSHNYRDEIWVVTSGQGQTIVDGMKQKIQAGDVITMSSGCRHTVIADTELKLIEVQLGTEITVEDKKKFELE